MLNCSRPCPSPEPRARAQAVRVANYWSDRVPNTLAIFEAAIKDTSPRVRLEGLRALSFMKVPGRAEGN